MLTALLICLATGTPPASSEPLLRYSDGEAKIYSAIAANAPSFPEGLPLLPPKTVVSPWESGRATVTETDSSKVPYDREEAHIQIDSQLAKPMVVVVRDFRVLKVRWVSDRLLFIWRDIGHVGAIEELLDVVDQRWLSQRTVEFRWP